MPPGLLNPGNFCYINSAVQALIHTQPILKFIIASQKYDTTLGNLLKYLGITKAITQAELTAIITRFKLNNEGEVDRVAASLDILPAHMDLFLKKIEKELPKVYLYVGFRDLIKTLKDPAKQDSALDITGFYRLCAFITRDTAMAHIVDGGQNDAVEFIMCLIDYLHDSHSMPGVVDIDPAVMALTDAEVDALPINQRIRCGLLRTIHYNYKRSYTPLYNEVYFYMLNIVICQQCQYHSLNYSPYNMLCLPLNKSSPGQTLYDTLDTLFCRETLDCEYKCEKCGNKTGNCIEKKLLTPPKTLMICLKRFDYKVIQGMGVPYKVDLKIMYPMILDVGKYHPSEAIEYNTYKLVAVINHMGHLNYGHYYSYCYHEDLGSWFSYNDAHVAKMTEADVLNHSQHAYILFYERIKS